MPGRIFRQSLRVSVRGVRLSVVVVLLSLAGAARADDFWTAERDRGRLRAAAWCGVVQQQIIAANRTFTYQTMGGESLPFDGAKLGAMESIAGDLGLRVYFRGPVYVSFEGLFGGVFVPTAREKRDDLFVGADLRLSAEGGGAVGIDLTPRALVHASLEAYGGARVLTFFLYHGTGVRREWFGEGVLEPRARLSVRVAHSITIGLWAGTNLIEPGESRIGLVLTIHTGGRRQKPI